MSRPRRSPLVLPADPGLKTCLDCRETKPLARFPYEKGGRRDTKPYCHSCVAARHRAYVAGLTAEQKTRLMRNSNLQAKFGIGVDEYDRLFAEQGGICAVCDEFPPEGKFLDVDHDHKTGKTRGLLCSPCNIGLGRFRDDTRLLMSAAAYLIEHEAPAPVPEEAT